MADVMKLGMVLSATDKMSRVIDQAVGKSAKSLTAFQQKANKIGKSVQKIGAGMSVAGGAITGALFADVSKMAEKAKQIQFSSQKIGLSTDEFQKLGFAASKSGMDISQFEVGIGKLSKTMVTAALGQNSSMKIFKYAGISATDNNGKLKTTTKILKELSDKFSKSPDGPKKTALAMMLFGKSGKDMIPMLNKGGKAIEDLGKKLEKSGALLGKDSIDSFKKYRGAVADSKLVLEGFKTQIAIAVLPTAIKFAEKIAHISQKMGNWIAKNKTLFTSIVSTVGAVGAILSIMGTFTIVVGTVIRFVGTLTKVMSLARNSMVLFKLQYYALAAAQKISVMWTALTTSSVWAFTAALLANPVTWVVVGIMALVAGLVLAWKKFETFRAVIKTTWEVVKGFGGILKEYVLDRIRGIISGFGSLMRAFNLFRKGKFADAGSEALKGIKDLTGVTAAQKAMKRTVVLAQTIKPTYSKILAVEKSGVKDKEKATVQAHKESKIVQLHAANKSQSVKTVSTVKSSMSNSPQITYAPVIHVNGGSPTAKVDFMKALKDNQKEVEQFLKKIAGNQQRVSYTPSF